MTETEFVCYFQEALPWIEERPKPNSYPNPHHLCEALPGDREAFERSLRTLLQEAERTNETIQGQGSKTTEQVQGGGGGVPFLSSHTAPPILWPSDVPDNDDTEVAIQRPVIPITTTEVSGGTAGNIGDTVVEAEGKMLQGDKLVQPGGKVGIKARHSVVFLGGWESLFSSNTVEVLEEGLGRLESPSYHSSEDRLYHSQAQHHESEPDP